MAGELFMQSGTCPARKPPERSESVSLRRMPNCFGHHLHETEADGKPQPLDNAMKRSPKNTEIFLLWPITARRTITRLRSLFCKKRR
jgi:hypothetical protein